MAGQPEGARSSPSAIGPWPGRIPITLAYFASKGAIPAMTRALAVELARRNPAVRVNCILPGPVMLPENLSEHEVKGAVAGTLLKAPRPAGKRRPGRGLLGRERLRHRASVCPSTADGRWRAVRSCPSCRRRLQTPISSYSAAKSTTGVASYSETLTFLHCAGDACTTIRSTGSRVPPSTHGNARESCFFPTR